MQASLFQPNAYFVLLFFCSKRREAALRAGARLLPDASSVNGCLFFFFFPATYTEIAHCAYGLLYCYTYVPSDIQMCFPSKFFNLLLFAYLVISLFNDDIIGISGGKLIYQDTKERASYSLLENLLSQYGSPSFLFYTSH